MRSCATSPEAVCAERSKVLKEYFFFFAKQGTGDFQEVETRQNTTALLPRCLEHLSEGGSKVTDKVAQCVLQKKTQKKQEHLREIHNISVFPKMAVWPELKIREVHNR